MPISDYLSFNIIICISFDLTHFRELGQKYKNIFVVFLVQMKIFKSAFEINWPLETTHSKLGVFWGRHMLLCPEKPKANALTTFRKCSQTDYLFTVTLFQRNKNFFFKLIVKWRNCKMVKGQTNLKLFFQADVPSKKRTNKFDFTICRLVFVRFLEESEDTKKTFQN